jgi:hypothetical protein
MRERPKRKAIPDRIKLQVVLRQDGRCPHCGERLGPLSGLNFDHRPAIINRPVNEDDTDYVPPQLDPEYIEAIHELPCHRERTIGRGGEKRITTAGSDIGIRDKTRRLVEAREAREAKASNLISPNYDDAEKTDIAEIQKSRNDRSPKRKLRSANRWPPKKIRQPYRRKGV